MKILVLHGPNLNMLGAREVDKYGKMTLDDINAKLKSVAEEMNVELELFQSNSEAELVNRVQGALNNFDGIVINPAAFTHTSIAIRDAILAVNIPTVEVHLSNIYSREEFRHHSFIAPISIGQICGFKEGSYIAGLKLLINYLNKVNKN